MQPVASRMLAAILVCCAQAAIYRSSLQLYGVAFLERRFVRSKLISSRSRFISPKTRLLRLRIGNLPITMQLMPKSDLVETYP